VQLDVLERAADEPRLILADRDRDVRRQRRLDLVEARLHAIDDVDGVRAGLLPDLHRDRGDAVQPRRVPALLNAVLHAAEVCERGPETPKLRIGCESGSTFWIAGGRVSRGNRFTIVLTLSRTS